MLRLSSYVLLAGALFLLSASGAKAGDVKWTVADVSGAATVVAPAQASHKLAKGEALPPGATLTTGADGKVVFGDGKTVVTVSANSRLTMPANSSDTMTRFAQDLGSVFFEVEKRPMQHFEVQTPLIAAVVKGTKFTVDAGLDAHSVAVSEGLVEVVAMTGGQKEMVPAGRSAEVRSGAPTKLKVAGDPPKRASADSTITRAIGLEAINYSTVTDGLVTAAPATGLTTASSEGGSRAATETNGATTETTVAAVDLGAGADGGVVADVDVGGGDAGGGSGISAGLDAGIDTGGSGGVGVGVDVGAGTGGSGGTGVGLDVGVGVGGTPPGQGGESNGVGVGIGIGLNGDTPPGQGGTPPGQGGTPPGQSGGVDVDLGVGGIDLGLHLGKKNPHG